MKLTGQTMEILGIVVLGVALLGLLFFLSSFSTKGYVSSANELTERQELESFKAGVNSIMYTTEPKTGKTLIELLGIASTKGNTTISFGPGVGIVDVKKELEWRFDSMYGKGNWYLKIPFPNVSADIQMVAVVDTSASMCDQIKNLVTDVPSLLDDLRAKGKKAEMTIFFLGDPQCCVQENGRWVPFKISKYAKNTDYFHLDTMPQEYQGITCKNPCDDGQMGSGDEDWGAGTECAITMGPYKGPNEYGWRDNVVKVAIPISDELPGGIECGMDACISGKSRQLFDRGLKKALKDEVRVFPFRGETCAPIRSSQMGSCEEMPLPGMYCSCSRGPLANWMTEMANKTDGEMYDLSKVSDASDAIEKIIKSIQPNRVPYLEAGTIPPSDKNIRSVTNLIPVTTLGKYVEVQVYHWNPD